MFILSSTQTHSHPNPAQLKERLISPFLAVLVIEVAFLKGTAVVTGEGGWAWATIDLKPALSG